MTYLEVVFRYGAVPGESALRAIDGMREVYGVRRVQFNDQERTVRVEFDASRLKTEAVARLLRQAGMGVREPLALPGKPKDSRGGLADGGGKCKGAPKKTSGRSSSWSAPLRATSSGSTKAHDVPFCKLFKLGLYGCTGCVGIALEGARFTSLSVYCPGGCRAGCGKARKNHGPRRTLSITKVLV